jgi:hypothetical protein
MPDTSEPDGFRLLMRVQTMRKFILLVSAATMATVVALLLLFGQPTTATNHATVPADPDGVSSIPHLPLHTLRPLY